MAKRTSPTDLSAHSFRKLHAELRRRQRKVATIQRRRGRLADKLAALDDQIRELGGAGAALRGGTGRRPRNNATLAEALHEVLKSKTMRVTDAAQAVQKAGYKTTSRSFRVQVNIALLKRKDLFKRAGRGQYTAK